MFGVAKTGTKDMVQTVLETTTLASDLANVYDGGKTLISLALLKNKNDDAVDLLIAHCPAAILQNVDAKGRSPLSYAVSRATGQATRSLLAAAEMDTSAADRYGYAPLFYAISNSNTDAACQLIAIDKTQINNLDCDRLTPLMHASERFNIPAISALVERPDLDLLVTNGEGHAFLRYLMKTFCSTYYKIEARVIKELDNILCRILHLLHLQRRVSNNHHHNHNNSPLLCTQEWGEDSISAILHRFALLLEYFDIGLDISRCGTIDGFLEILGEKNNGGHYDKGELFIRVLRRYVA
ncbi:hypothetical protein TrVFT333_007011 [Trichoderma virens FT-333]|nr:hypothetical protein TrVFT333_007011 [Trichoderma virens FT-333]